MTILIFDGTWVGLLCCVYEIYERKLDQVSVVSEKYFQPDAFSQTAHVFSDESKARRVWTGLTKLVSKNSLRQLYSCYLSELPKIENTICEFIRLAFDIRESPEHAYATAAVLRVSQVDKMVHREKHRMEAFIRFHVTSDDLYYASIEPDFNVLPLITKHFKARYADQNWLIYDLKRNYGIYYNLETVSEVTIDKQPNENCADLFREDESLYQNLWSDYFKNVNITERKNTKLHLRHVPKRYWKFLTEKKM